LNVRDISLPKREELSLRTVRAFPNASRIGLDWRILEEIREEEEEEEGGIKGVEGGRLAGGGFARLVFCVIRPPPPGLSEHHVKNPSTCFVVTVFPLPDSPETSTVWLFGK